MKILTSILIGIMMFTMSTVETSAQVVPFNDSLQEVELSYSGGTSTQLTQWNYTRTNYGYNEGWIFLGWPNYQSLINDQDYMPEGDYTMTSLTEDFRYMMLGNILMDLYTYTYVFELEYDTNNWIIYPSNSTTDPSWSSDFIIENQFLDVALKILDSRDNSQAIFTQGYNSGRDDWGIIDNGVQKDAATYGQQQYQAGLSQGAGDTLSLQNMIPGVLGVFIAFFFQVMSISVLGVSILDIIALMFGVAVVLLLFKTFVK